MKRFLLLTIVAATIAACSHAAADKREAMNERCLWMSSQAGIFAQARDKGFHPASYARYHRDSASQRAGRIAPEPREDGIAGPVIRHARDRSSVYDVVPSLPPDQVATKVSNDCRAQIAQ